MSNDVRAGLPVPAPLPVRSPCRCPRPPSAPRSAPPGREAFGTGTGDSGFSSPRDPVVPNLRYGLMCSTLETVGAWVQSYRT